MAISNWMAALALVNGTTGGVVLVLPIIGLDAGWLMIPILILLASICCYYTATLMFMHLGNAQTINKSIMNHFGNNKYCEFYNLTMFASFFGEMILYFDLLVSESEGFLHFTGPGLKAALPYFVAGFLVMLALVARFYHFQDNLLCYGILSMIAYAIFIAWIIIARQPGSKSLPIADGNFIDLGAAMSQGFSIHNMMIPIILRARDPQNYKKILANVFTIGAVLYTFIAYGSFALVNRVPMSGSGDTVEDYFSGNEWQIYILRTIYILNIITVFPEFLSISKIRFFNMFSQEEEESSGSSKISIKEILYFVIVIGVCLVSKILKFRAPTIIELNGSIICFVEIYFIPIGIHLKCIWMSWHHTDQAQYAIEHLHMQPKFKELKQVACNHQEDLNVANLQTCHQHQQHHDHNHHNLNNDNPNIAKANPAPGATSITDEIAIIDQTINERCPYHSQLSHNQKKVYKQVAKSITVLSYGIFVMLYTFYTVFFRKEARGVV